MWPRDESPNLQGFAVSTFDRANLEFLLKASAEDLTTWSQIATEEDRLYAQNLMAAYALELQEAAVEMRIESELTAMHNQYILAADVLKRFH
jgi:hypothetical protein